jgi:hypothetical protein
MNNKKSATNPPRKQNAKEDFLKWFTNNLWSTIYKIQDKWVTNRHYMNPDRLWDFYNADDRVVGVRPGKYTRYAVIDIDKGSIHHPSNSMIGYNKILESLEELGLVRVIPITSSYSGGMHLYVPLPREFNSFSVAVTLKHNFESFGLNVAPGQLEIFPNQKGWSKDIKTATMFNGHRLPLQEGSYMLDDDLNPYSDSIDDFANLMEQSSQYQDIDTFESYYEASKNLKLWERKWNNKSNKDYVESPKARVWKEYLESVVENGWTGDSQTNKILQYLCNLGIVFKKLSGEMLIEWMTNTAKSMPGFNVWCGHIKDLYGRCNEWVNCTEGNGYYKPYCSIPDRLLQENYKITKINKNDVKSQDAQNRILDTIHALGIYNYRTVTEFINALRIKSKELFKTEISNKTLYKHKSLWEELITIGDSACESNKDVEVEIPIDVDDSANKSVEAVNPSEYDLQDIIYPTLYEGICSCSEGIANYDIQNQGESNHKKFLILPKNSAPILNLFLNLNQNPVISNVSEVLDDKQEPKSSYLDCSVLFILALSYMVFDGRSHNHPIDYG